jgi:hypothetical protein
MRGLVSGLMLVAVFAAVAGAAAFLAARLYLASRGSERTGAGE